MAQALADAKPDAIFSSLFGADLAKFVREGSTRGLFKGVEVFNLLGGEPEYLDPLKDEAPVGWYVTGYPWYGIDTPEHKKFLDAYQAQVQGLSAARLGRRLLARSCRRPAAIKKAGSTDTGKAGRGDERPAGRHRRSARSPTARSTISRRWAPMSAASASRTARASWSTGAIVDGKDALPSDDEVKKMRPAN